MSGESDAPEPALPQPARFWTIDEANVRLSGLREQLPKMRSQVVRLRKLHDELHRLAGFWGKELEASDNPDRELKSRLDNEWKALSHELEESVTHLQEEGIEVKDLESGLIDFYGIHNGEVVFLCWQRGEDEVGYFHTLDGGYRNRRPLPDRSTHEPIRSGGTPRG